MDVVIPYLNGSYWRENELRHSLRSLEKNLKDLDRIFLVGQKPAWVKNVIIIKATDPYADNKGANIINKLLLACNHRGVSKDFLYMTDDKYILQRTHSSVMKPYYFYDLKKKKFSKKMDPFWKACLENARDSLVREGLAAYHYEPHTPIVINKKMFINIMQKYMWASVLYPTLSLYLNNALKVHRKMPSNYRAVFFEDGIPMSVIRGKKILCHSDMGLSAKLQNKIMELFPDKSRYEK